MENNSQPSNNPTPPLNPSVQNPVGEIPPPFSKSFLSKKIILLIVIVLLIIGASGTYLALNPRTKTAPTPSPIPTPTTTLTGEKIIRGVGEQESSFLIQKINPDNVEGLWYNIYPIERPNNPGLPKTLYIGDDIGYSCEGISDKLTSIDFPGQRITFTKVMMSQPDGMCPVCLAGNALIDTPSGLVPVKDLQVGMPIWTIDKAGHRVFGIVTKTSKVPAPPTHQMVHLILDDGRELFVSPRHPTADERIVGDLTRGDLYNGTAVASTQRVTYGKSATYDVLPAGETGFYWASGILLGSTLSK